MYIYFEMYKNTYGYTYFVLWTGIGYFTPYIALFFSARCFDHLKHLQN